jgi:hypothetical protein
LFRAHGVDAALQDDWVAFPNRELRASASIVSERNQQAGMSVQLDVRLEITPGRTIIESFAGVGKTREKAVADASANFTANSFHVLLAEFFQPDDQQVTQEEWIIGGRKSRVTVGNVGVRGKLPLEGEPMFAWFKLFRETIKRQQLRPGIHWARFYYAQAQRRMMACEVLVDNLVGKSAASEMTAFEWPCADDFYSVRVFLVMDVEKGGAVGPADAVAWLADILGAWHEFTEKEAYAAMADAGIPDALAARAYTFTQVAWGRTLLDGLGVQFSLQYLCFDASGTIVESGDLADEPCFAAATRLAERYKGSPGFKRLAMMSADFHAVNNALNGGSKPEDLVTSPACLFLEAPTAAGMEAARQAIAQYLAAIPKSGKLARPERAKPWWQFWR